MTELLFILLAGLCFGSFITCMSYRLPLEMDAVKNPSFCPSCNTKLGARDLVPVLSWAIARGRCRHCQTRISARYPLIEVATALTFLGIYTLHGLTLSSILLMLFAVALLIMIVTDLEHFIIPDEIHIALVPLGLFYHYVIGTEPLQVAGGFLMGMVLGLLLHHGYRFLRKREGLGYGDVKFFAVAGLWLTPLPMVVFLFLSGPARAVSLMVCVLWPGADGWLWEIGRWVQSIL